MVHATRDQLGARFVNLQASNAHTVAVEGVKLGMLSEVNFELADVSLLISYQELSLQLFNVLESTTAVQHILSFLLELFKLFIHQIVRILDVESILPCLEEVSQEVVIESHLLSLD